jgi:hypothetical protein
VLSYVNDIVVVSREKVSYISDLMETFTNMCEAKLKLNPDKCVFGVTQGKVLGCLVSTKGIEARPYKIKAILQMQPPAKQKRSAKVDGPYSSLEQVHREAGRKKPLLFQHIMGLCKSRMGPRVAEGLR